MTDQAASIWYDQILNMIQTRIDTHDYLGADVLESLLGTLADRYAIELPSETTAEV